MEQDMTERLVKFLRARKTDFILLSKIAKDLKEQLGLKGNIKNAIAPHLGERLMFRVKGNGVYLCFKMPDEIFLFRIVQACAGQTPNAMLKNIPFKKDDFLTLLNRLTERGEVRAMKFNKVYVPCLYPVENAGEKADVSEESFRAAFRELEGGNFYVRICDMRRRLNWSASEFDVMLKKLRDSGQLQLQDGDIELFTQQDIYDSFVDENGFRMLTMKWRQ
jgi:hypothetical protein